MATRSGAQIRSHAQKFFLKVGDIDRFIIEKQAGLKKDQKGSELQETSQSSRTNIQKDPAPKNINIDILQQLMDGEAPH